MNYNVCDIHAHIAPGVDDGAANICMAIDMLRSAYNQGVRHIVCTSHSYGDFNQYRQQINVLRRRANENGIDMSIYTGSEIYCDKHSVDDVLYALDHGYLPTMNNTDYVLVEFNPRESVEFIVRCIVRFMTKGYKVILAHVERYSALIGQHRILKAMSDVGCLFQINAYSLQNETNIRIKTFARYILNNKLAAFIGSDAHRTDHRPHMMRDGIDYIYKHCDTEYAKDVCYRNAAKLLNMR